MLCVVCGVLCPVLEFVLCAVWSLCCVVHSMKMFTFHSRSSAPASLIYSNIFLIILLPKMKYYYLVLIKSPSKYARLVFLSGISSGVSLFEVSSIPQLHAEIKKKIYLYGEDVNIVNMCYRFQLNMVD